ncbi:hypothetical protein QE152_g37550 [Popillia japonica]|uniref:Fibronectin type-III domain-containing protein n=1 Tax=Popillia japonica TaxID=7064 RepID=A0AAW1IA89_POPJA
MGMSQKNWKIAFFVVIGIAIAIIVAGVIVLLVILLSPENFCDRPANLPRSLSVSEIAGDVRIEWTRATSSCDGSYLLQYSIKGKPQIEVPTTDLGHTVVQPPICSDMLIQLRTVGESGRISEESLNQNYTVLPLNAFVTNTIITRTDSGIIASWEKPMGLEACDISYAVRFTSEFGQLNEKTTSQSVTVPENKFCLSIRVEVSSIVGFSATRFSNVADIDAEPIKPDLSISSDNPFVLIATWSHHNEDKCSLTYEVTHAVGLDRQTFVVSEPRAEFNVRYCITAVLTIQPSAFDGEHAGRPSFMSTVQYPDNIVFQPVENVEFVRNGLSMTVSWDLPHALNLCDDLYNVTARNKYLDEEGSCQGSSGCIVTLSSFCPSTDVIINPIGLLGNSVHKIYNCMYN